MNKDIQRVFVVDDEPIIAMTLATILNQSGFHATFFTNPLVALKQAENDVPQLLLSDVMMPQISGIELAIELCKQAPQCRVLLFSGQAATADLLEAARAKGHSFQILAKPVHPKDLLAGIKKLSRETGAHESA